MISLLAFLKNLRAQPRAQRIQRIYCCRRLCSLIRAAYEAEQQAFTPAVIRASFANCGLCPFNTSKILTRFAENTGVVGGSDLPNLCREAAGAVIRQAKAEKKQPKNIKSVTITALKNQVFSPEAILLDDANRQAAKVAEKQAKLDFRQQRTCRFEGCKKLHRSGSTWFVCECEAIRLCPKHRGLSGDLIDIPCSCNLRVSKRQAKVSAPHCCSLRPVIVLFNLLNLLEHLQNLLLYLVSFNLFQQEAVIYRKPAKETDKE